MSTILPDERRLVTLADGHSFIVDEERLVSQDDGTFVVMLNDMDRARLARSKVHNLDQTAPREPHV